MNFFKIINFLYFIFFICVGLNNAFADSHDKKKVTAEEPLPLNDPFAGDASIDGSSGLLTVGSDEERERLSLYRFKLVGIIKSVTNSYVSLVDSGGEVITLALHEELSEGVKLVELRVNEAIFEKDDNSYLVINFKNQIKEVNEY
tara:strand:- start:124 stop:558 length:435 start_codon:yes stop_codon:yes gene_type:complete